MDTDILDNLINESENEYLDFKKGLYVKTN